MIFFGYGYVAGFVRRCLSGVAIQASTRTSEKADALSDDRIEALVIDFLSAAESTALESLRPRMAWLISVPPTDDGCPVHAALESRQVMASHSPAWIGYLSSTSVYGDLGGKWAFEETEPAPISLQGKRRHLAEQQWLEHNAHIFRLPGIYGPGRSALDAVGRPDARRTIKPGQVFSRAHVEDIATAVIASLHRPHPGRIYNIADDLPAPSDAVLCHAAGLLRLPEPPALAWDHPDQTRTRWRFYRENRRVSNARLKAELSWRPRYPDYRCGLEAIFAQCSAVHA